MRNREHLDTPVPEVVHPAPQVLGVRRVHGAERGGGDPARAEDHVAMQREPSRGGRVLVPDERRERPGVVVSLGGIDGPLPGGSHGAGGGFESRQPLAAADGRAQRRLPLFRVEGIGVLEQAPGERVCMQRVVRVVQRPQDAQVRGVVGDAEEVERPAAELHLVTQRMGDGFSFRVPVGIVRRRAHAEAVGVEGVDRVDVEVAEQGLARMRTVLGGRPGQGCPREAGDEQPGQ